MYDPNPSRPDDPRPEETGKSAAGNEGAQASPIEGDSPTHGTVEGPLAAQSSPGDAQAEPESEGRPTEKDPRKSDGVAEFKKMEEQAEAGRE